MEATVFKSQEGSSCAAPAQDHFTYPEGPEVVSLSVEMEMDAVGRVVWPPKNVGGGLGLDMKWMCFGQVPAPEAGKNRA